MDNVKNKIFGTADHTDIDQVKKFKLSDVASFSVQFDFFLFSFGNKERKNGRIER